MCERHLVWSALEIRVLVTWTKLHSMLCTRPLERYFFCLVATRGAWLPSSDSPSRDWLLLTRL